MSDEQSARWGMPLLVPGQAQKEMTHNEALTRIDLALNASVIDVRAAPPAGVPEPGSCWIVGAEASGAWAGCEGMIAGWTAGGWRFVEPREGMLAWVAADARFARFGGGVWYRGAPMGDAVSLDPVASGGAVVDGEARVAITALHVALAELGLVTLSQV